ncbi:hypothetical protein CkaCkLH20_09939 [Colletotrichum karsti]|uniref:Alpha/beta hydrolase fold-3 domain-containing protein n=1 Tax=Colletotrichum karsti TaxID=1095194 RepID=A0A9P6HWD5_9PEZI|nr:uncharacterized protein CkaCkLH20_09939 [Colletotrichum karsti]KAF9872442.1 hypothetical protein CkaCkLH20_09939 [Colletotrichum karsti]
MLQEEIQPPVVSHGPGYGYLYSWYLHCTSAALRAVVASMSGTGALFDKIVSIPTPGLGDGQVTVSICLSRDGHGSRASAPLVLVAEGGGFVLGQPNDGEHILRPLADQVGAVIVSVDYAKSPRWPFPHALLQLYEVIKWALSPASRATLGAPIHPGRIAVMGNSAGGNLVACLALLLGFTSGPCARFRRGLPSDFLIATQIVLYPSMALQIPYQERLNSSGADDEQVRARSLPSWVATMMEASYTPPHVDKNQIFVAPALADVELVESLQMPNTLIVTAGKDCLKFEARRYAETLRRAGVSVTEHEYPEAIHGFSHHQPESKDYRKEDVEDCWERIRRHLKNQLQSVQ